MDKKSIIAVVILAVLVLFYWPIMEFLGLVEPAPEQPVVTETQQDSLIPGDPYATESQPGQEAAAALPDDSPVAAAIVQADTVKADTIIIRTENYEVMLSSKGGGPVSILLNDYTYRDGEPIQMMPGAKFSTPEARFAGGTFSTNQLSFASNRQPGSYDVTSGTFDVVYTYTAESGATMERRYVFYPDQHHFDHTFKVSAPQEFGFDRYYSLAWNTPLGVTEPGPATDYESMQLAAMMGGSRTSLDDFEDGKLNQTETGNARWAGLRSKYFAAIMIPHDREIESVFARGKKYDAMMGGEEVEVKEITGGLNVPFTALNPIADSFTVFVGPLDYMMMEEYGVGLEDMMDIGTTPFIGWLIKPFAIGIIWLLPRMYNIIPNYGLVIILFALLVKIITLPLSMKSFKSMQAMKDVQPKVDELKVKYKKDPQRMN
ncbi:MAG: membrane protein insertase YidC, partial [candidate division Zixibacteria bacterium]|nr:membrane protein insertase YidC [candidate division Zixibacteria bacterium]